MITFGALYYLVPRLWKKEGLYSLGLVSWHFWLATIGIVLYASSMWVAGIMQGLMWREYGADGYLVYAFSEVVTAMHPMYLIRALGGVMYLAGMLIMVWNIVQTIRGRQRDEKPMSAPAFNPAADRPLARPALAAAE
jgi:cytochrome c oxidase cbb3-type subunit 1